MGWAPLQAKGKLDAPRDYTGPSAVSYKEEHRAPAWCRDALPYTPQHVDAFLPLGKKEMTPAAKLSAPPDSPGEITEKQTEFLQTLRRLKTRGVRVKFSSTIPLLGPGLKGENAWIGRVLKATQARAGALVFDDHFLFQRHELSPERFLSEHAAFLLERDPALMTRREKRIQLITRTLHVERKGDSVRILVWDWLQAGPLMDKRYANRPHDPRVARQMAEDLAVFLKKPHRAKSAARWRDISPAGEEKTPAIRELFHGEPSPTWSGQALRQGKISWRNLAKDFRITLTGTPYQEDIDRGEGRNPLFHRPLELQLTPGKLRRNRFLPLSVRGLLDAIYLEPKSRRKAHALARELQVPAAVAQWQRDKYGNAILPLLGEEILTGKETTLGFVVMPRFPLVAAPGDPTLRATGLDLSSFGLGDHPQLLSLEPLAPVRKPGDHPYSLYSTLPAETAGKSEGVYEQVARGAAAAERFFALPPGNKIKNIFFIPSLKKNASVHMANPETIFIWDEMLPALSQGEADYVVAHEAYHSLDMQFSFSTHPRFLKLFERLSHAQDHEMFSFINESQFLEKEGGHSQDDVFEFFASLVNTLEAPEWEERVKGMCPRSRGLYYHSLLALKEAFVERHPGVRQAPVFRSLERRIQALKESSAYPPVAELIVLPASELLRRGRHPVEVLPVKDFKKTLRRSRRPVLVHLFTERDQSVVPHLQALAKRLKDKARVVAVSFDTIGETNLPTTHFGGHIFAPGVFLFDRGRLVYRGELSTPREREKTAGDLARLLLNS